MFLLVVVMKIASQEFPHVTGVPTRSQFAAGFLTRKRHEKAYDAFRAVFVFSLQTFMSRNNSYHQNTTNSNKKNLFPSCKILELILVSFV